MDSEACEDLDLRKLAERHRTLTYCFLGIICAHAFLAARILVPLPLVCAVLAVFVVRVLTALRVDRRTIVLACVGMFVPLVNLVVLVAVAWKASAVLQRAGIRVGLFGARPEELARYGREHQRCVHCWADMSSSRTGYCPACGLRA